MTVSRTLISANGPEVSRFIAGFWRLKHWGMDAQELLSFIQQNIELGVTTMDHAMVYRSEAPFGAALALKPELRDKMEIVTKFGIRPVGYKEFGAKSTNHYDSGKGAIIQSVEASLRNLRTDYIDILLVHRPDYLMQPEEVVEAFEALKSAGKVKYFGVSNFSVPQFELLQKFFNNQLVTNQIELSPYRMQALDAGVLEQCMAHGVKPMLWSCLAGGALMQPNGDLRAENLLAVLTALTEEVGAQAIEQVIYAWLLALPSHALPLLGSSRIERIKIATASEKVKLTREQWYSVWEASTGHPVP